MLRHYRATTQEGRKFPTTRTAQELFWAQHDSVARETVSMAFFGRVQHLDERNFGEAGGETLEVFAGHHWKVILRGEKPRH